MTTSERESYKQYTERLQREAPQEAMAAENVPALVPGTRTRRSLESIALRHRKLAKEVEALLDALPARLPDEADAALVNLLNEAAARRLF